MLELKVKEAAMQMELFNDCEISDFIHENMIVVSPEAALSSVYAEMQRFQIRHIPVVEKGEAVGIISDRDIQFISYYPDGGELRARDVMTENPYSVSEDTPIREIVNRMGRKKISSALIHNERGKVTGIFTSHDALQILADFLEPEEAEEQEVTIE